MKKLIALVLCFGLVGFMSIGLTGCDKGKTEAQKKAENDKAQKEAKEKLDKEKAKEADKTKDKDADKEKTKTKPKTNETTRPRIPKHSHDRQHTRTTQEGKPRNETRTSRASGIGPLTQ